MGPALERVLHYLDDVSLNELPGAAEAKPDAIKLLRTYDTLNPGALDSVRRPEVWSAGALHRAAIRRPPPRPSTARIAEALDVPVPSVGLASRTLNEAVPETAV